MLLALLASFATAFTLAEAVPVRLVVPVDVPLLVDVEQSVALELEVVIGEETISTSMKGEVEAKYLDVYEVLTDEQEIGTRTVLKAWYENDGTVEDPPITGAVLRYVAGTEDTQLELVGDRVLPNEALQGMLRAAPSLWVWVDLPETAEVGAALELDVAPVGALLFGDDFEFETATANVTFDAYDADAGIATFSGEVRALARSTIPDLAGEATFEGPITLVTDVPGRRVRSLTYSGDVALEGEKDGVRFSATGRSKSRVETTLAPDGFRPPPPSHRDAVRAWDATGLSVTLPSFYGVMGENAESFDLIRTLDESAGQAIVQIQRVPGPPDPKAFFAALEAEVANQYDGKKMTKVRSPLGEGRAMVVEREEGERSLFIRTEFYPWQGQWIAYKLSGDAAACALSLKDFEDARKTLKGKKR